MGSCVSVHKDPKSAMKLRIVVGSKTDKVVIPAPIMEKEKSLVVNGDTKVVAAADVALRSLSDFGSKEEAFFDSQPWLESDCEDDFFSVNGDFTPSRGNTPVHHNFAIGTARANKILVAERAPASQTESSPTDKKKRLSELFKESLRSEHGVDEENRTSNENGVITTKEAETMAPKSPNETSCASGVNSVYNGDRTPNGDLKSGEKSLKSAQCCLPRLRSFSEKKKRMSPLRCVG